MGNYIKAAVAGAKIAWNYLSGKKTYIAGFAGLIYGLIQGETEIVIVSLGLLGLRHGIASEVAKLIKK